MSIGGAISNCSASATINGNDYLGGLVGKHNISSISDCSASGTINGNNSLGGLVGEIFGSGVVRDSSASVTVSGSSIRNGSWASALVIGIIIITVDTPRATCLKGAKKRYG